MNLVRCTWNSFCDFTDCPHWRLHEPRDVYFGKLCTTLSECELQDNHETRCEEIKEVK